MTIDKLPTLNSPAFGEVCDATRPILSYAWRTAGAHRAAAHAHPRAHIIAPEFGALWVVAPEGTWLVPAGQAIWIPPDVHHEVYSHGAVSAQVLFVDPAYASRLSPRSGTVLVSPLLAQLIWRAVAYGNDYAIDGPEARLGRVVLDELAAMERAPLLLPVSKDPRLSRAMDRLIAEPGSQGGIEQLARAAGASSRTMARLFRSETGMTFNQWKTRLRLVASIERLTRGSSVTDVAMELGYASTSSFVYMFRRNLGVSPGRYSGAATEPRARGST